MDNKIIKFLNVSLLGKDFTGKTNLSSALTRREIEIEYVPTIGVDYMVRYDILSQTKVGVWDLAGQKRFRTLLSGYIKNSKVILLCYIHNDLNSFNDMVEIYHYFNDDNCFVNSTIIIVSTKYDNDKIITNIELENRLREFTTITNFPVFNTSSWKNIGVKELFEYIIKLGEYKDKEQEEKKINKERKEKEKKDKGESDCVIWYSNCNIL